MYSSFLIIINFTYCFLRIVLKVLNSRYPNFLINNKTLFLYFKYDLIVFIISQIFYFLIELIRKINDKDENELDIKYDKFNKLINRLEEENDYYIFIVDKFWADKECDFKQGLNRRIIDINDSKNFIRLFSEAYKKKKNIKIIMETTGGTVSSSDIISRSILEYPYGTEIYIPSYAYSAGTFISLASNKIYMNKWAFLGPTDPQFYDIDDDLQKSSHDLIYLLENKKDKNIQDYTYLAAIRSKSFHEDNLRNMRDMLSKKKLSDDIINKILIELGSGIYPHSKPFNARYLKSIGLEIEDEVPDDIMKIYKKYQKIEECFEEDKNRERNEE